MTGTFAPPSIWKKIAAISFNLQDLHFLSIFSFPFLLASKKLLLVWAGKVIDGAFRHQDVYKFFVFFCQEVLGLTRAEFDALPAWKQLNIKREVGLF